MIPTASATAGFAVLVTLAPSLAGAQSLPAAPAADAPPLMAQLAPPPLPQPPSAQFYYDDNGKPAGPLSLSEIQAKIAAGAIKPDTLVWKAGTPNWVAAREQPEVAALLEAAAAPNPAPGPAPAAAPVASACSGKVLMSDDFRQVDAGWGVDADGDAVTVEDGKVKVKAPAQDAYTLQYGGYLFDDAQICVTVQMPRKSSVGDQLDGGLIFWAQDYSNYYYFGIAPDGTAAIIRKLKGKYIYLAGYRKAQAIKSQPSDKNLLRVRMSGNTLAAYINEVQFASLKAQAPAGGGKVGLRAQSEKSQRDTWKFMDFEVTDLGS
ncbi:MAG: DUF4339 domain-containing protein [Hyphomicrobiales bacterium]